MHPEQPNLTDYGESGTEPCDRSQIKAAYCTVRSNSVTISDILAESTSNFQGPQVPRGWNSLVHDIPDFDYLVCSNSPPTLKGGLTRFEVYQTDRSIKQIFSVDSQEGEILDITHNPKTKFVALLSKIKQHNYHLFCYENWQLLKRARWQAAHNDIISSLDFSPCGDFIASMDQQGVCVVSEVTTDETILKTETAGAKFSATKCRWNPNNSCIALSFNKKFINLLDPASNRMIFAENIQPYSQHINWIDWNDDGNLLSLCSREKDVKIFDVREGAIVRSITNLHKDEINCVKWSPSSKMILTGSSDGTMRITDFKTEKMIHSEKSLDNCWVSSVCFMGNNTI